MAKPDCDDGWIKIAHELYAALACAGFNKWESVVIRETLHQIYGPAKKREAILSPTDIASRAGTFKESIVRAIRSLKASGVILEAAKGVRFVKDYERWTWDGNPRLNPVEVRYCKDARPANPSTEDGNESVPHPSTEVGNESAHASVKPGNESVPISKSVGNESVPNGERIGSPAGTKALPAGNGSVPRAHSIERAELRIREEEEREKGNPAPSTSLRSGEDAAHFDAACVLLSGSLVTEGVAMELRRRATLSEIRALEGWRWLSAAQIMGKGAKAYTVDFLHGIARKTTREEFEAHAKSTSSGKKPEPELQFVTAKPGWDKPQPRKAAP